MTTTRNTKTRNPRRAVLESLREIKRWAGNMVRDWDQGQTTYDRVMDDTGQRNVVWRKRRDDEKIENSPESWDDLAHYMRAVALRADEVARFAFQRAEDLREKRVELQDRIAVQGLELRDAIDQLRYEPEIHTLREALRDLF